MRLLVASAASLTSHLEVADGFEWIGATPALVVFAVAAVLEVGHYLVLLDNALDVLAAPTAWVGTILMAASIAYLAGGSRTRVRVGASCAPGRPGTATSTEPSHAASAGGCMDATSARRRVPCRPGRWRQVRLRLHE